MRRAIALGLALLLAAAACARVAPTVAPPPSVTAVVRAAATSTSSPAAVAVPSSTFTASPTLPAATATAVPSATPTVLPSATAPHKPTHTPPPPTVTAPPSTPTPERAAELPQEVTTAVPQSQWPHVSCLVVTPDQPPILYAVIGQALYRSEDRGGRWSAVDTAGVEGSARILALALDYRHPTVMYLATSAGIYRREGESAWSFVHTLYATALAVDLIDANTLWAGVPYRTEYDAVLLKSTDRGRTWGKADAGIFGGPGGSVGHIAIDPTNPNVLYANLRYSSRFGWPLGGLFRGGRDGHWEQLEPGPQWGAGACLPNGLAFDPQLRRLYVGCDAYYYNERAFILHHSDNAHEPDSAQVRWDEGMVIWPTQASLAYGSVRPLAVDAREPKALYVAVSEYTPDGEQHAILVSEDDGETWRALPLAIGE